MRMRTLTLKADPCRQDIQELPPECPAEMCSAELSVVADEIDVSELRATLSRLQLIDVREAWERATGAILPSIHVPLAALQSGHNHAAVSLLDASKPTVVFCTAGARSRNALALLREHHGFTQARSLRGGYRAWREG
jgi:adenylyltransferase/sulfurtransferase